MTIQEYNNGDYVLIPSIRPGAHAWPGVILPFTEIPENLRRGAPRGSHMATLQVELHEILWRTAQDLQPFEPHCLPSSKKNFTRLHHAFAEVQIEEPPLEWWIGIVQEIGKLTQTVGNKRLVRNMRSANADLAFSSNGSPPAALRGRKQSHGKGNVNKEKELGQSGKRKSSSALGGASSSKRHKKGNGISLREAELESMDLRAESTPLARPNDVLGSVTPGGRMSYQFDDDIKKEFPKILDRRMDTWLIGPKKKSFKIPRVAFVFREGLCKQGILQDWGQEESTVHKPRFRDIAPTHFAPVAEYLCTGEFTVQTKEAKRNEAAYTKEMMTLCTNAWKVGRLLELDDLMPYIVQKVRNLASHPLKELLSFTRMLYNHEEPTSCDEGPMRELLVELFANKYDVFTAKESEERLSFAALLSTNCELEEEIEQRRNERNLCKSMVDQEEQGEEEDHELEALQIRGSSLDNSSLLINARKPASSEGLGLHDDRTISADENGPGKDSQLTLENRLSSYEASDSLFIPESASPPYSQDPQRVRDQALERSQMPLLEGPAQHSRSEFDSSPRSANVRICATSPNGHSSRQTSVLDLMRAQGHVIEPTQDPDSQSVEQTQDIGTESPLSKKKSIELSNVRHLGGSQELENLHSHNAFLPESSQVKAQELSSACLFGGFVLSQDTSVDENSQQLGVAVNNHSRALRESPLDRDVGANTIRSFQEKAPRQTGCSSLLPTPSQSSEGFSHEEGESPYKLTQDTSTINDIEVREEQPVSGSVEPQSVREEAFLHSADQLDGVELPPFNFAHEETDEPQTEGVAEDTASSMFD